LSIEFILSTAYRSGYVLYEKQPEKYRLPSHKECYYEAVSPYGNRPPTIVGERRLRPSTIGAAVQFHGNTVVTAIP
jgi:hypothetical protein